MEEALPIGGQKEKFDYYVALVSGVVNILIYLNK